jgi:hypothetical protein
MPEVESHDQQLATLLPAFRERHAKAKSEAERVCESAMHLYVLPALCEVQRELYGTYRSRQSHHLASQGESRLLFTREQMLEVAKSGIPAGGIFAMVNAEGMMARDEEVSQPFEDAL